MSSLLHTAWRRGREMLDWSAVLGRRLVAGQQVPVERYDGNPRVALISVSFNTKELTKLMLLTVAERSWAKQLQRLVIVDNASRDGSYEFLRRLATRKAAVLQNPGSTSHGVGLRYALDWLERDEQALPAQQRSNLYLVVDSDIIFLRDDTLEVLCSELVRSRAALLGELQFDLGEPYAHPCCLLLRRDAYRDPQVVPFVDHGAPALWLERSLRRAALRIRDFPIRRQEHIVHRGRGSIAAVNRLGLVHAYATVRDTAHFHGNPFGAERWSAAEQRHAERLGDVNDAAAVRYLAGRLV
jgi:hypothetical protein